MEPVTIGLTALVVTVILLALRIPVAAALASVAGIGIFLVHAAGGDAAGGDAAGGDAGGAIGAPTAPLAGVLSQTAADMASAVAGLVTGADLWVLPLVVMLGNIAFYTGITTRIYDAAAIWLRPVPGGLAMASVLGCGGFSAISGSSIACASTMGRICVPEMLRLGYDPRLATSSVAVGGTLGALIPPSVLFILYGIFTGTPVGPLFLAGILPGLLSLAGMLLVIGWWVIQDPGAAPAGEADSASRAEAALAVWPAVLLFAVIVGGIWGGLLTATGAAAVCVVLTIAIGFAQGRLAPDVLWRAIRETLMQTAGLVLIAAAAAVFVSFVALSGAAGAVAGWVQGAGLSFGVMMLCVVLIFIVLGMFLEPIGILVLTLPLMAPLVEGYGLSLIWFGVVTVKLLEIGLITPPVGLNVFVVSNVTRSVRIDTIFAGVWRFLFADLLVLALLILFPLISLLLPGLM
ncbi:MAG: TRAP transporter large permease [Paracoccus sp. (in: a-proteobacteria)]|uniref:TRAP transporter large permease n=1 Tax=Paracoccus sp. TaxID=267 RepID=UPI00391AD058